MIIIPLEMLGIQHKDWLAKEKIWLLVTDSLRRVTGIAPNGFYIDYELVDYDIAKSLDSIIFSIFIKTIN